METLELENPTKEKYLDLSQCNSIPVLDVAIEEPDEHSFDTYQEFRSWLYKFWNEI